LIGALLVFGAIFLWIRNEAREMSWEEVGYPLLIWGLGTMVPGVLFSWPSRPGSVTLDWSKDAVEVRSGRWKRELGLRRVRAVELRNRRAGIKPYASSQMTTRASYWHELIVWVEPEGGQIVPFLMATTQPRREWRKSDEEALECLAQALAAHLGVPLRPYCTDSPPPFE